MKGQLGLHTAHSYGGTKIAVEKAKDMNYKLSITGHSLGAYLAELSIYYCHMDLNFKNVKGVTFDGPGSLEMMKQLSSNLV
jgi:putative lipase involved disintegration of autophagic bodies